MSDPLPASGADRLDGTIKLNVGLVVAAVTALSIRLWPQWRHNPDLSHGLFMPLIFLVLLYESRAGGTQRYLRTGFRLRAGFTALLSSGLLALCIAGLYAAAVDWSHALVNFMLAISVVLLLGSALLVFSSDTVRWLPFNWSAVTAVGLWILTAPIPPGTYSRLTLSLQLWVSENVLSALHLLGVAAIRYGNIIQLANATVGVEEACSGVRSLISCVFAGIFFSAILVHRPWARALLIALAAPLALGMNFLRSLALTLLVNRGVDIAGTWHDVTGFAVLGVTAAILGGLALLLERRRDSPPVKGAPMIQPRASRLSTVLAAGLACAATLTVIFVLNTRPSPDVNAPVPDLLALLPAAADGWEVRTSDYLYQFRSTLQTENLAQRTYSKTTPTGPVEVTIYLAYWRAGQAPVSLVASHTPDACWPGAGWSALPTAQPRGPLAFGARVLPEAEYRFFKSGDYPQHVWFWHLYDRRIIRYRDPYSPLELLRIALRFGFRHEGDQLFVRVSSTRPWADIAPEPLLAAFFAATDPLGL